MQNLKLFSLLIISIIALSNAWDYAKHGADWGDTYNQCRTGQQSPAKIVANKAEDLDEDYFFYANLNVKEGQSRKGQLQLIEDNNILSLEIPNLGNVIYNMYVDWLRKYDEEILQEAQCTNIMFKVPGEHTIEGEGAVGEMQVNCTFQVEGSQSLRGVFISIPIKIDENNESGFSKALQVLVNDQTTKDNLPKEINFDVIDIIDGYVMQDGVFYYEGQSNYPPCSIFSIWFYVNKPVNFSQKVVDQLKKCMDSTKCPDGNNRTPADVSELYLYEK